MHVYWFPVPVHEHVTLAEVVEVDMEETELAEVLNIDEGYEV